MPEEDTYSSYARTMMKYFCAEAVMTGHALFLSSCDVDPQQILKVINIVLYIKKRRNLYLVYNLAYLPVFVCSHHAM